MRYKYPLLTRRILFSISLLFIAVFFNVNEVRASLGVGDIAVIGWNSDPAVSTKDFAVVVLATISSGETIYITDKGITLGAFQSALTTEGIFSWTTTSTIAAGTVIKFSVTSGATPGVTSSPGVGTLTVTEGWTSTSTAAPFGNNGDQIIIFQGSTASPTFIYGFNAGINTTGLTNGWNTGGGTANNYSEIPPGLTNGTNAVGFGGASALDNYSYTGTFTGTKAALLAAISNSANWGTDDTNAYSLAPGGTQFPGTNPIFNLGSSNSAPTNIALSASAINENVAANATVGALSSTDADVGNTFTYTLVAGTGSTDNASFNISGSNLRITASPDFETKSSYSVRIRTTDQGSLTFEKQFTITINDLNEAPTNVALSASSVNENVAANTTVGAFSSTDVDAGNTFTYTLVAGTGSTDNASFNISGSNLRITASPDFETKSSYSVRIRTTDQGSLTFEKQFTITINDLNEAPTDVALSASSVNENVAANTIVGTFSSTDVDAGNTFTYTLVAGTGSTDNASFNISGSNLRITASPDFETKSSYSVRIRTTDQGSLTFEKQFTITINDLAEGVLLSSSPTLTFTSNPAAITGDDIASDGEGGSQSISDIDIQVYNISNTSGTLLAALSWQNNSFMGSSNGSYSGVTNENNAGSKGMAITSATGSEFRINQFIYYNWGETSSFTNTVKGYRDGSEVASTTFDGFDPGYTPKTITLTSAFQNVDEVRFYISAGGYMGDQSATNHSINSIALASPVVVTNSAPTDIALTSTAVNENVAANTTVGAFSSTDVDASNTFTYTLVAGTGSTDNASFNISGSNLRITASPDFETKSSYSVRVRTTDQGSLTFEKQFTITINDLNEAPTDVALSASSVNENVAANTTVGAFSSTDVDAGNTFTYTLVAGTGSTDNASFNISGSNLRITSTPDFETKSSYSVRIRTTDQGSLTFEKQFTITINDLNEAPTDVALSASSVNENVAANTTVGAFSSTDVDAGNTFTYTLVAGTGSTDNASFNISGSNLRITASPDFETKSSYSVRVRTTDQGSLTFEKQFTITINDLNEAPTDVALSASSVNENVAANTTVGAFSSTDVDAGNTFTYTLVAGTGSTDNASFNISGSNLRITASPDFETKSSYSVRVRTTDQGSLTFEKQFTITINDLNEAPTDVALSASSVNENVAANTTVGALSSTDVDAGNTFTYTLVAGTGSTDNASFNISGSNLRITSTPDFETKSSYSVRIRTTDQGSLTFEKQFTITINDLNEAPTDVALSASSVNENVAANTTVGALSSTDVDAGNTFTYTLVAGTGSTDNASFNISGSNLRITASPDFETKSSYSVRVRTTDQGSLTFEKQFTITINDLNEAPTDVALSASSVNENVAANTTVGAFSSTDVDAGNTFTYTLVAGTGSTDNASFNISGSNLRITSTPDFETKSSYSVRIRTTDQGSLTFEKQFTITINDLNEAPTDVALSASSVNENVAANTTVGAFSSTDVDAGNTFTYTLVAGTGSTDNASFNISGSNLRITASPDFETKSSYSVRIRTTDQGSLTFEKQFTITINDLNEAPTDVALSASSVNENVAANTIVGTFSSTDVDAGNTFTYTLVAGTGSTDNASFNISGSNLRITASPDFETKSSYSVRIRTTDQGSLTFEKQFTITINDLNEAPTDVALSASSVNENVAANTTVGAFSSTDVDASNTFTYTLVAGTGSTDNASFNISGSNLRITASPDFETKSSYSVRVRTTDQGSLTFEKQFTITINDLNEAPTDVALSASSVNENVSANTTIGAFSSTDVDAGNTFTYTLVAGTGSTDNASFNISGSNLRITASPDFETKSSYSVRVRTTDQGSLTFEKQFTITINDLVELVLATVSTDAAASLAAASATLGGNVTADGGASVTERGLVYNTTGTPTTSDTKLQIGAGTGTFSQPVTGLSASTTYYVRAYAINSVGTAYGNEISFTTLAGNSAPTDIALSATLVSENVAANTTVGTLSSTDVDLSDTFTYTLVAGTGSTDNASFNISGNNLRITATPDFEIKNSYSVRVRTTDQGSLSYEEAFTITINDVNEAPTDMALSASAINENVAANTTVGTISTTDEDAGNTFTYTLVAGSGDTDNASFNISGNSLRITASPDFETKGSYSVRLRTTDQNSLTYEEAFAITINDVNEAPSDMALSASSINENVSANATVGTLSTIDPDASNTFTYTLVAGTGSTDNASFNVSGNSLRITNSPDFETKASYSVRVRTTDQNSLTYEEAFTITVNDVNEAPTDMALSASSINENVSANATIGTISTTDPDAGNTFTYTLVAGTGSADNASFNISGSSLRITSSPDFESQGSYSVRVRTTDQNSLTYEEAFIITINDVNEAPTDIALSASAINENVAANSTVGTFSSTDVDAANTFTYTLVAGTGSTDNTSFNISGSSLRITASPDFETKSSYSVRVRTTDQGSLTFEKQFTITINDLNEAPADVALSASSVNENVAANTTVGTLSSTDVDAGNTFTYTLVAGTGSTDNASFNISGSNLSITGTPDFETKSSYSVRVRTTDQGSLTFEKQFTITINDLNEAPTDIALSASTVNENVSANATVGALSSIDVDAGNTFTYSLVVGTGSTDNASFNISGSNLRITASPDFETKSSYSVRVRTTDQGSLTFEKQFTITINDLNEAPTDVALSASSVNENVAANTTVGAFSSTDVDASNTFTYSLVAGTGSTDNASFNISGSNLRITASPDFETKSSYTVRVRTTDQGSLTYEEAFTITINDLNETPTDMALSASAINENVVANATVGTLSSTDVDAGNTFTYTLVAGTGSTDNASFSISGSNLRITASPDFETKNSYSVRVRTTDQGSLTYEEAFTITINDINEAPTDMALSASAINENVAANATVGTLSTTDPDASNTFTYTLVSGTSSTDNASFNISGNSLRITSSPDFESQNSYSVRVRTTDQGSLMYEESFTITINDVNEAPTDIALSASSINENVSANTSIGTLSTTDPDASNTFAYTLVAGTESTDNASFNIISGNILRITASPDFETKSSYSVRVRTTDQNSLTYEEAFTITVNDVNEAPTDIALSASSINENVSANATIGTLSTTDPDASNTFTYTLVAGTGSTDNASFNISGSNLRITASPDFETKSSYSVRVRTTDQGSLTFEKQFTITINDLNEAPTDVALSASSVNENVVANATVGTLSSTDVDAGNTFTYSLVAGTGSTDNASFNISGSNLRITASPDFETKSSYSVRVRTTDQGSLTYEEVFTITINDLNEAPTDMALSASSIDENVSANATIGNLSSTDADAANTFTYTLVAGSGDTDNVSFNISGSSLQIINSPDVETKSSYTVRVRTTDQGSLTYEEAFTITINDLNETPTDIALSASAVNENVSANATVGTLSSTDVDAGSTFTYTLVAGSGDTDNASFNISSNSLRITASPDFETKSSYTVRVRTTDQGSLTYEEVFIITINDLNEAPTDIALSASTIDENVAANATIGTLSSTDEDAANTFTYTLVAGAGSTDNAAFTISGNSLSINASPDFESKNSYSVRIRTTDQGSLTYEEVFIITINDLNETPTDMALSASAIDENVVANATVGTLSSTDEDASNTFTYTLIAGAGDTDNASFNISGNSLQIINSPDFETKSSYTVRVRTTDQGSLTYEEAFTITINDLNEVPTDIALSSVAIDENVAANATIGTLSSTDVDAANTFTYTLVTGSGDADNASFNISGSNLRITASPDFETKSSYTVRVRTTDQGSLTYEEAFTITINDLNEAPTDMALSALTIDENVPASSTVGTLSSTDEDASNTFTYTLVAGSGDTDNASFTISGNSLQIINTPDFETKSSYTVRVRTTDQGSLTYEEAFIITINDLNEVPTDIALSASAINENVSANSTVGTLSSADVDAANTFTYTLVTGSGDTDNAAFTISGNSLRITASPDFETKNSYSVRIRTTDQGSLTYEEAFTITINDLNEAPTDMTLSSSAIDENVSASTTVGTLSSTDEDASNTFTYTLVVGTGDTDNASFNISGNNIQIINSPDFETKNSYSVRVRTTDQGSLPYEEAFTITINDLTELPVLTTDAASSIGDVFATLGGNVTWDGGGSITERGVVYNTTGTPTTADSKAQMGSGVGLFSQVVTGLAAKTTYYVRAYAINSVGTSYGGVNSLTTLNTIPTIGGAVSNQPVNDNTSLNPFASVTIADTDGDNLTATITLDDVAKGRLYANDKVTQLSNPYNISSASSASIQSLVRGLYFIPANNRTTTSETTTFTIAVSDGIDNANNNTTTVVSNAVAPTVTKVDASTADGIYKAGSLITVTVYFSEPVTVTGTPQLQLETGVTDQTVNYSRIATHLEFDYIIQSGDESSDLDYIGINALTLNGGTIKDSGGKDAILTLATPGASNSLGSNRNLIVDTKAPSGYTVKIDQSPINKANANAVTFTLTGAEVGAKFTYTYSSSAGGNSVTVSNLAITTATQTVTISNAETVSDGVVTISVTLTDVVGNIGLAVTDAEIKDTQAPFNPNGLNAKFVDVAVNSFNEKNIKCQINNGEIGTTYHYSITNVNAPGEVTGSGTIADVAEVFFVDLSSLTNGELKLEVTLTDQVGNESEPVFDKIIKSSGVAHHEIPQGFTPNGDGVDDRWVIPGIEQYPNNEVKIYNRYGTVVWKTKGYDNAGNAWDSYSNASNVLGSSGLPEGTYFYVIDLGDNKTAIKSGYVIVKR